MEKLLEIDSGDVRIGAGHTARITVTIHERCVPQTLKLDLDVLEHFIIEGIYAGVEPLLLLPQDQEAAAQILEDKVPRLPHLADDMRKDGPSAFKPIVAPSGQDFSVAVRNTSSEAAVFKCEVWGELQ